MLAFRYNGNTSVPVEVEGLTPSAAGRMTLAEIERFEIFHGNRKIPLAEFFEVRGDPQDGRFEFEGNLSGVHWIGAKMSDGEIHVHGDAGRHVGSEMTGGVIHVHGNASDWVGAEMNGGLIHVHGTVLVLGACGNRPAANMRRGTVGLLGGNPPNLLVSFRKSCVCNPPFLRLMFRHLQTLGFAVPREWHDANYSLYHGDRVSVGRGEILVREQV